MGIESTMTMERQPMSETDKITEKTRGCMDGRRKLIRAVLKKDGSVEVLSGVKESAEIVEAQLPGADLGFVALMQDQGVMGDVNVLSDEDAVSTVGALLRDMGLQPQFHVDNDHGHREVPEDITADQITELLKELEDGCGFAGLIWKANAHKIIGLAKENEWVVEVLGDAHSETEADEVLTSGQGINTSKSKGRKFVFTPKEIEPILVKMEEKLGSKGFAERGMKWFNEMFELIYKKLSDNKISTTTQI